MDKGTLLKLENIFRISSTNKLGIIAQSMNMSEGDLSNKLVDWTKVLPLKIENDDVFVEDLEKLFSCLQNLLQVIETNEKMKNCLVLCYLNKILIVS